MPENYNPSQSKLEMYAINGHPSYPGTGRIANLGYTSIGKTKYAFKGPYKNPEITGNAGDAYGVTNTNALADTESPYNGRGTGDGISQGVYGAIHNYNGGNTEDINGVLGQNGTGRNSQIALNIGTWGFGPNELGGSSYSAPDMSLNLGQVNI